MYLHNYFHKIICQRGASNEYQKICFRGEIRKITTCFVLYLEVRIYECQSFCVALFRKADDYYENKPIQIY